MAGHEWEDWFEREEFIGQISDIRVQNLQVEREVVQKRTFTRWMNLHLEKCDPPIEVHDLFRDIQDGRILMALLEELSGCKLLHGFKKSSHRIFRLNNIAKVLSFLEERNVKLVSIDAADVADGNSSIILGLIWNIILFFQIKELTGNIRSQFPSSSSLSSIPTSSDSDTSYSSTPSNERQSASAAMREHSRAIKKLLQWVQKRTRKYSVAVQDFGKSWTSGLAFLAVIKSIDSSLVDMRKALLRSARENLEDAFRIAHFSLGIARLLEPEDVMINTPDEQSIMTYVAQFLEHFPGIEEPEKPCKLIERSVSMGGLNYRDPDFHHTRNGASRGRVKERSFMFEKDSSQPPPKILISSVSEDRGILSPRFRPAASRSWSTEEFLMDSPHMDDNSSSVVEDPNEPDSEVLPNSISNSPQLSYTHSPTGSSVPELVNTESVMGDSAISSPDSWVESEFGVMPEKLCESRSDSSLCDSGTAWDVYRATPVEVTNLDEGFVPAIGDRVSDDQSITESYIDEGICSLSSLESTQERNQGNTEKYQEDNQEVKETEENLENHEQDLSAEDTKEVDSKQMDAILPQKDEVPTEQEPSFGLRDAEELANSTVGDLLETDQTNQSQPRSNTELPPPGHIEKLVQNSVEASIHKEPEGLKEALDITGNAQDCKGLFNGQTDSLSERNNPEEVEVETECQKTDYSLEEEKDKSKDESEIVKEKDEGVKEIQSEASEVLTGYPDPQEKIPTETGDSHSTNQDGESIPNSYPCMGINIPLISISSESKEQDEEETSGPEGQDHAGDEDVPQTEAHGSKGTDTDVNRAEYPDELACDSNEGDASKLAEIAEKATTLEQITDRHLDDTDEHDIRNSLNAHISGLETIDDMEISEDKEEPPQTGDTDKDLIGQSSTDAETHPVNTEQDIDSTYQPDEHQDKLEETIPATTQQNTDPENIQPSEDLVGDFMEPMDLFYPDKEEPMFTEPPDNEMQSWPSVLSVSALQPAPASDTLPEDQPLNLLEDDIRNGGDLLQEQEEVITKLTQETDKASELQEQCLLPEQRSGGLWDGDVPPDGSDLSEAELQSSDSARENTEAVRCDSRSSSRQEDIQIPPLLRHRKGARFTEATDNQTAVTAPTRKDDNAESDSWWSDSCEPYLLLLLWLLLYCFWLLPQMDLKSLPSLLLNLNH
ncbi:calmin isoform X2 [Scomber japonicus]|uniref:calmin isoform X2 n=1 Tax=Scomber japonicus TaxID=13676 RepID=UPI002305809D|nr:calmin isoform X2 [Scomber japonicus]